jgi:hypothetical protein
MVTHFRNCFLLEVCAIAQQPVAGFSLKGMHSVSGSSHITSGGGRFLQEIKFFPVTYNSNGAYAHLPSGGATTSAGA